MTRKCFLERVPDDSGYALWAHCFQDKCLLAFYAEIQWVNLSIFLDSVYGFLSPPNIFKTSKSFQFKTSKSNNK